MAIKDDSSTPLALTQPFLTFLGLFYSTWSSIDLTTDYAIFKFLKVTPQQSHLITSGMMFGRKARLLVDLVRHSADPNKARILGPFNKLRGMAKRDVFAHSHVASTLTKVTFIEHATSGEFKAIKHTFTFQQFMDHAMSVSNHATDFYNSLSVTKEEIEARTAVPEMRTRIFVQ